MKVLNVGGGASRSLPTMYDGWDQDLLDIDPAVKPDIICDAKLMQKLPKEVYDAVYCSHTLEHFYQHEVNAVLTGFNHVLKEDGFTNIIVPDLMGLINTMKERNYEPNDIWYRTGNGTPISFHDVLYGWGKALRDNNLFYAHKCGFSARTLSEELFHAGFKTISIQLSTTDLNAFARKSEGVKCP